jgi:primosomal protein N' (replication factor Y)
VGVDRGGRRFAQGGGIALTSAARIVPAVPTFAVDRGFWYSVPDSQKPSLVVGSMVRIPLGGRRVRGFVVELGERDSNRLRPVTAISMALPVFDEWLLAVLTWAAQRYVAPLSVLLERTVPPNRVSLKPEPWPPFYPVATAPRHPLSTFAGAVRLHERRPPVAYVTRWADLAWLPVLTGPAIAEGRSAMVVAATGEEVTLLAEAARRTFADLVNPVSPEMTDSEITEAWARAQVPGALLIGSPRVASWHVAGLGVAAVVEEGRRAMKDRQTPTVSVRDLMRTRAAVSGSLLALVGPTPSLETIAAGATVVRAGPRAWAPVEVVDRNEEPPTTGVIGSRAMDAIKAVAGRSGRVFVFAHRRGYAPAARCENCRALRRCPQCGSRPEASPICPRCAASLGPCAVCGHDRFVPLGAGVGRVIEELRRVMGSDQVAAAGEDVPIEVGSEADVAGLGTLDLAVAVDADGLILGTHFRAAEEALRVLARVAGRVGGRGARALIQTHLPEHPVVQALRKGDPVPLLEHELAQRERFGFPPAGELLIVEARGQVPDNAEGSLVDAAAGATVLGPATRRSGALRWLLQAPDLTKARYNLRNLVQQWRDAGVTVRIDVDPIDL